MFNFYYGFGDPVKARERLLTLGETLFIKNILPKNISNLYVYSSRRCPGDRCSFCLDRHWNQVIDNNLIKTLSKIFIEAKAKKIVFSGGGEPTVAINEILNLIKKLPNHIVVEIQTCAFWAHNDNSIEAYVTRLNKVAQNKELDLRIRVSIGKYVRNKIPITNPLNLINNFEERKYKISLFFYSVYLNSDKTVEELAKRVKGSLSNINGRLRILTLPNKNKCKIIYSNLSEAVTFMKPQERVDYFSRNKPVIMPLDVKIKDIKTETGDFKPGLAYNDVFKEGKIPNVGLSVTVDADGRTWI